MTREQLQTIFQARRDAIFGAGGTSAVSHCLTDAARNHLTTELQTLEREVLAALALPETAHAPARPAAEGK